MAPGTGEALALVRAGSLDRVRIDALLDKALGAFRGRSAAERMEMPDWEQRTLALQEKLAASPAPSTSRPAYPDSLTAREVEVLCLLAGGLTYLVYALRRRAVDIDARLAGRGALPVGPPAQAKEATGHDDLEDMN